MAYPSVGTISRKKDTVVQTFDGSLGAELFNLLWRQERTAALPARGIYTFVITFVPEGYTILAKNNYTCF